MSLKGGLAQVGKGFLMGFVLFAYFAVWAFCALMFFAGPFREAILLFNSASAAALGLMALRKRLHPYLQGAVAFIIAAAFYEAAAFLTPLSAPFSGSAMAVLCFAVPMILGAISLALLCLYADYAGLKVGLPAAIGALFHMLIFPPYAAKLFSAIAAQPARQRRASAAVPREDWKAVRDEL